MAMALEFSDCKNPLATLDRDRDAHEAASAGLESLQRLIHLLSRQHTFPLQQQQVTLQEACSTVADATIFEFKKVCSLLTKSGHARFRRSPGSQAASLNHVSEAALMEAPARSPLDFSKDSFSSSPESSCSMRTPPTPMAASTTDQDAYEVNTSVYRPNVVLPQQQLQANHKSLAISSEIATQGHLPIMETSYGKTSNTYPHLTYPPQQIFFQGPSTLNPSEKASQINVSYRKNASTYFFPEHSMGLLIMSSRNINGSTSTDKNSVLEQVVGGSGQPPLSVSKKRIGGKLDEHRAKCHCSGKCHCSKHRKSRDRRIIRVPAISAKMTDIPQDEFTWRKYGQKPIKGSPHPRSYYRCSSARDCPAKKRVERACDDSNMLVVTYEEEHSHGEVPSDNAVA